jgi:hypothetical protein
MMNFHSRDGIYDSQSLIIVRRRIGTLLSVSMVDEISEIQKRESF